MYHQVSKATNGLALAFLVFVLACGTMSPRAEAQQVGGCQSAAARLVGMYGITGTAYFRNTPGGVAVNLVVDGFARQENHPFHIHASAAINNNCASTGGHFNPNRAPFPCPGNGNNQAACEVGDLSGKGGPLRARGDRSTTTVQYVDRVINIPEILNRGVVVHDSQGQRIACAIRMMFLSASRISTSYLRHQTTAEPLTIANRTPTQLSF
ncbi:hypothetical protein PSTG_10359 [Puccinia striiformis f. sp. tritici PST-78]|uniref:Superoxide dismutase copper/zinc binding domain-containing protein n=1 Tax=Puccinia striiformis f. sp. tritici PST-78 TaxID=1165861 RepID=A0A0L0VAT0_9BASI|nr:hypothetical protein PSTG_10359 [Puccinia striiformis f. sp. tritici PST-78]